MREKLPYGNEMISDASVIYLKEFHRDNG